MPEGNSAIRKIWIFHLKWEIPIDVIIKVKQSRFIELHNACNYDGFRDGTGKKQSGVVHWYVLIEIGVSKRFFPV